MYGLNSIYKEGKEHQVRLWSLARSEQVHASISCHAPVVVLTTSINARKWFFVQQYAKLMTAGNTIHYIHEQQVVINRHTYLFKYRSAFKLGRSHFIVTS